MNEIAFTEGNEVCLNVFTLPLRENWSGVELSVEALGFFEFAIAERGDRTKADKIISQIETLKVERYLWIYISLAY
jgi:hypothetical protein